MREPTTRGLVLNFDNIFNRKVIYLVSSMLYEEFLKNIKGCPFCDSHDRIIMKNKHAFLTYSLAPYYKHHMLVLPERHVESFLDLTEEETRNIETLLRKGAKLLHLLGCDDYSILVRNGDVTGKSIKHLHYHLVPRICIGNKDYGGSNRKIMTEQEIEAFVSKCERLISKL